LQQWIMEADDQGARGESRKVPSMFLKEGPVRTDATVSTAAKSVTATGETKSAEIFKYINMLSR